MHWVPSWQANWLEEQALDGSAPTTCLMEVVKRGARRKNGGTRIKSSSDIAILISLFNYVCVTRRSLVFHLIWMYQVKRNKNVVEHRAQHQSLRPFSTKSWFTLNNLGWGGREGPVRGNFHKTSCGILGFSQCHVGKDAYDSNTFSKSNGVKSYFSWFVNSVDFDWKRQMNLLYWGGCAGCIKRKD